MRIVCCQPTASAVWLILLLPLVSPFVIERCLDESGEQISGCNCALTNPGIFCPANYYCPEYSSLDVQTYREDLELASCNVTGENYVVCPCTPGIVTM